MAFMQLHQKKKKKKQILPDQFWAGGEVTIHASNQGSNQHQAEGNLWGILWAQRAPEGSRCLSQGRLRAAPIPNWGLCSCTTTSGTLPVHGNQPSKGRESLHELPRDCAAHQSVWRAAFHSPQLQIKGCWDNFISAYKPQAGASEGVNTDVSAGIRAIRPRQGWA